MRATGWVEKGRAGALGVGLAAGIATAVATALALGLAGCTARVPLPAPTSVTPNPPTATPTPTPTATPQPAPPPPQVLRPSGAVGVVASGLQSPWSVAIVPDGGVLVSERDTARIVEVLPDGALRVVGDVPDVAPAGEGGLLGLAYRPAAGDVPAYLYAMHTAPSDNRIVRMPLTGGRGGYVLGAVEPIVTGIPKASNHDGGRLAFGPDGFLYATTGDAGVRDAAQDPGSLAGKILRMTAEGRPARGNPFGSLVWSLGHRNVQGIAWDAAGRLWATEFGQNTWDELNLIRPGANYGWPVVEGAAGDPAFVDPVLQWGTSEASPSGLAVVGDTLFLAALAGERVWTAWPATGGDVNAAADAAPALEANGWFVEEFGRIRDVLAAPDGSLWFLSNNTDGRGFPFEGDDRLYSVPLGP